VLDVGPIHAPADRKETIPLPPVLGVTAIIGGVVMIVYGAKKKV